MTAPTATQQWGPPTTAPAGNRAPRKWPPIFTHPLRVLEGAASPPHYGPAHPLVTGTLPGEPPPREARVTP